MGNSYPKPRFNEVTRLISIFSKGFPGFPHFAAMIGRKMIQLP